MPIINQLHLIINKHRILDKFIPLKRKKESILH